MAIAVGDLLEVSLGMGGNTVSNFNVWQYEAQAASVTASGADVAEAWWNHVMTTYRALVTSGWGPFFKTVSVRQLNNPTGFYGGYAIPVGEQTGTRSPAGSGDPMPFFNAVGVRLSVGTRATKPGQKRFICLNDEDATAGALVSSILTPVNAHMLAMVAGMTLGIPAALVHLDPIVTRKDATGAVTAHQPVTGFLIASQVTSQVSRKPGRGV